MLATARIAGLAMLWGSSFLWIKLALQGLTPVQITFARLALGAIVLSVIVWARRSRLPADVRTWGHLVIAAAMANAIPYTLFALGEQHVPSSIAGAMNATAPLWTLGIGLAVRTERDMSSRRAIGMGIGFAGAVIALAPWETHGGSILGTLECLGAALSYGVSYVYQGRFLSSRGASPLVLATGQLIAATLLLGLALPVAGMQAPHLTATVVAGVVVLGVLGTGIAYVLNYRVIADQGPTAASTVSYLLPVVSVVLGVLVLAEPHTWHLFVGTGVVLVGVALARRARTVPVRAVTGRQQGKSR